MCNNKKDVKQENSKVQNKLTASDIKLLFTKKGKNINAPDPMELENIIKKIAKKEGD